MIETYFLGIKEYKSGNDVDDGKTHERGKGFVLPCITTHALSLSD